MTEFFVDSWFYIALLDRFDSHHRRAERLTARLVGSRFVTHDAVFTEVLAYFSATGALQRDKAVRFVRGVLARGIVVEADRGLFLQSLDLYSSRPDKEYSLVDCMSMVVMQQRGIRHVLTNDRHFSQEGFTVVNE